MCARRDCLGAFVPLFGLREMQSGVYGADERQHHDGESFEGRK